jgi:ISXO2-like transposase domain
MTGSKSTVPRLRISDRVQDSPHAPAAHGHVLVTARKGISSVWAVLKRGIIGVYHHTSAKHLGRYVDEFAFRLNEGDVKRHTLERLDSFISAVAGKRLTYARLIA